MFMWPYDKSAIIVENKDVIRADVSENRLPETKTNFSDWHITANALSVPLCPLMFSRTENYRMRLHYKCELYDRSNI